MMPLWRDDILRCDDAMDRYCAEQFRMKSPPPVVRIGTYQFLVRGQSLGYSFYQDFGDHPKRPVLMRAALHLRKNKYTRQMDYGVQLAKRFLRRIKFTSTHPQTTLAMNQWISKRFDQKGIYVHYSHVLEAWKVYVDGEQLFLHEEELRKLRRVSMVKAPEVARTIVADRAQMRPPPAAKYTKADKRLRMKAAYQALIELGVEF